MGGRYQHSLYVAQAFDSEDPMAKTWTNNREPRLEDLLEDELTWKLLEVSGSTVEQLRRARACWPVPSPRPPDRALPDRNDANLRFRFPSRLPLG